MYANERIGRDNEEESKMRSKFTRMAAAIAAATITIAVLAGCSSNSTEATEVPESFACTQATPSDIATAKAEMKTAEAAHTEAVPFQKDETKAAVAAASLKVENLKTTAAECKAEAKKKDEDEKKDEAAKVVSAHLAQCRTTAIVSYMTEQGFKDGEFLIGVDNIDTTKPEFSRQGSLGFRGDDAIPATRSLYQRVLDSTQDHIAASTELTVEQLKRDGFTESDILDANNWEVVQSNVESVVIGNTGLNGGYVVHVGNTEADAGDAAWIFVNMDACVVPRLTTDLAGNPVPEGTPLEDRPVAASRPGCINATGGMKPQPKDPALDPAATGNLPTQQQPNQLQTREDHRQPTEPTNPNPVYAPPAADPAPVPAPDLTPEPEPIVVPPVETPPGTPPSTCSPKPGSVCP